MITFSLIKEATIIAVFQDITLQGKHVLFVAIRDLRGIYIYSMIPEFAGFNSNSTLISSSVP